MSIRSMTMRRISDSFLRVCSRKGKAMLSKSDIEPKRAPSWNMRPKSLRVSMMSRSGLFTMSTPLMSTRPFSGFSSPMMDFRKTVFPVPEGPSMTLTSPAGRVRLTSCQMFCLPKDFVRPSTTTSIPIGPPSKWW